MCGRDECGVEQEFLAFTPMKRVTELKARHEVSVQLTGPKLVQSLDVVESQLTLCHCKKVVLVDAKGFPE